MTNKIDIDHNTIQKSKEKHDMKLMRYYRDGDSFHDPSYILTASSHKTECIVIHCAQIL